MHLFPLALLTAAAIATGAATAQTAPAKPPAKAAAKKAPAAPAAAPLPTATPEQINAAERIHFGNYDCEFAQKVDVSLNPKNAGYIDVTFKKDVWVMKPVASSTGALRLEDVKGRMLMIQIANKSMLMDAQAGRRIVDECVHEKQREAAMAAKMRPGDAPLLTNSPAPPPPTK